MSATQNALLSRSRSARVPSGANASRSLTTNGLGSSQTHATDTASNVSLFLSNLRLLDLDHLPDWPDINALTFTNKDAAQGQKKRIHSVEWALYQLFSLWDPDETRNKLQPFFPPADQLQSTNLRAALLRCLDQAKKNGVLGRDTVLRKTMLDECKGDRLEEILAVFSSAVLKKMVAEQHFNSKEHAALAHNLALEKRGYSGDRTELSPLILAHKWSLRKKLDQKNAARAQYNEFARLMDSKERETETRDTQTKIADGQGSYLTLSENDKTQVRRAVRNNWTGNERWMDALLYGDAKSRQDGLLAMPFDRVWRRVRSNRLEELQDQDGGLLEQLNERVNAQKERLDKWQNFHKEMFGNFSGKPETKSRTQVDRQKGIDLGFEVHESLQLGRTSPKKVARTESVQLHAEYSTLLEGLGTELEQVNHVQDARPLGRLRERTHHAKSPTQSSCSEKPVEESVSELSELEEDLARQAATASHQLRHQDLDELAKPDAESIQPSKRPRPKLPQSLSSQHAFRPKFSPIEISPTESTTPRLSSSRRSPVRQTTSKSPSPVRSPTHVLPPSPERRPQSQSPILRTQSPENFASSPTQHKADQILESMNAASPSPVKQSRPRHTLSLAERTRLSMVRGSSVDLDDDDEPAVGSPSPTRMRRRNTSSRSPTKRRPGTSPTVPEDTGVADAETDKITAEDDLVARTRRSMANFEATQQKARLEKQRSLKRASKQSSGPISRQSYFPSQEEEEEEEEDKTEKVVLEELIAEDGQGVDYEAVFKSRPKIKTSPPSTPIRSSGMWD
ncbi:hypothetical protein N0V93_004449 [Gnomoniopsis smithogilvyi]|uniref:HAUS augmin-like complex subunit 6 N-terminal domain-containing protein n=1 Tax=Gnomoniopsis smithogilvyi TaxID=1191159 RepID=A0A9W8YTR1_9PEZI|nr:hypothetical protein N0V93_004449 [Gnomoniopsis smithogilvyi]